MMTENDQNITENSSRQPETAQKAKTGSPTGRALTAAIRRVLGRLFYVGDDKAPEQETIESIKNSVDFRGAKLWILILAIFVASLGLNTNSAAVIIGAMLISPIMGPIMGMGLGVGINDFELFKRSFRSFFTATVFSVLTATFYFLVTPIAEAQSELLARTAPTIYDVFIALCGGLAGIIALSSVSQRSGNVIPGVAIATALMPPICTTGFGIATGNWLYAAGAFYLYLINTIFISLATFLGVHIMHFQKKVFVDKQREKRVKHIIATIAVVTMIPASWLTYRLARETVFEKKAADFVRNELVSDSCQIVTREFSFNENTIRLVLLGQELEQKDIDRITAKLPNYGLNGTKLSLMQGGNNLRADELKRLISSNTAMAFNSEQSRHFTEQQKRIDSLERELALYRQYTEAVRSLRKEMHTLFPQVDEITLGRGMRFATNDSTPEKTAVIVLVGIHPIKAGNKKNQTNSGKLSNEERKRLTEWLRQRIGAETLRVIFEETK